MSVLPSFPSFIQPQFEPGSVPPFFRTALEKLPERELAQMSVDERNPDVVRAIADELLNRLQAIEPSPGERLIIESDEEFERRVRYYEAQDDREEPERFEMW